MSDNVKSLIEESSVSQLIITVALLILCGWVQLTQGTIPEWLKSSVLILLGFYFGGKSVALTNKSADVMKRAREDATSAATASAFVPTPVAGIVTSTVTTTVDPVQHVATVETVKVSQPKSKAKRKVKHAQPDTSNV